METEIVVVVASRAGGNNHNEMNICHKGGVTRHERGDQTRHVIMRVKSVVVPWGDDDAEGDGKMRGLFIVVCSCSRWRDLCSGPD